MSHPVLIGEFELTIDGKNRLLVPAEIRRAIPASQGEALYLSMGINRTPWLYPERYYEELVMRAPTDMIPGDDLLAFDQLVFGLACKIPWDKQGRILIPDKNLKRASIGRDVTLVGVRDHLELWDRAAWDARREELERRSAEVFARARQARQSSPTSAV